MLKLLEARKSTRNYTDKKIEVEKIEILKKAVLLSPSARNKKEWEFVFVDDKELLSKLATVKPSGGKMLENATLGIVVLANEEESDLWIEDASIAAVTLQYTAESLGIGSCWVHIRERMFDYDKMITSESKVREILGIPDKIRILCIISLGYSDEINEVRDSDKLEYSKMHLNKY